MYQDPEPVIITVFIIVVTKSQAFSHWNFAGRQRPVEKLLFIWESELYFARCSIMYRLCLKMENLR